MNYPELDGLVRNTWTATILTTVTRCEVIAAGQLYTRDILRSSLKTAGQPRISVH